MRNCRIAVLLAGYLALGVSTIAKADPIEYGFEFGTVQLLVDVGLAGTFASGSFPMNGVSVILDADAPGTLGGTLLSSLNFTASGPVSLTFSDPPGYAGWDSFTIESFSLTGGPGSHSDADDSFVVLNPVLDVVFSTTGGTVPLSNEPVNETLALVQGDLLLESGTLSILDGLTSGPLGPFDPDGELTITLSARMDFTGLAPVNGGGGGDPVVPEPRALILFMVGALTVFGGIRGFRFRRGDTP
jgi:hypothetical protein